MGGGSSHNGIMLCETGNFRYKSGHFTTHAFLAVWFCIPLRCVPVPRDHPERPERLQSILTRLSAWGLAERCHRTAGLLRVCDDQLLPLHEPAHLAAMADSATEGRTQQQLDQQADRFNSLFLCPESHDCARLAAGCVLEVSRGGVTYC